MSSLPVGTVTFLFTDVEGSARLWEAQPTLMPKAIETHEAIAREEIEAQGGHLILERGEGDSLFAVFASPSGALRAAVGLQLRLKEPIAGVTLKLRMGVHTGEAQARGTTYFGRAVNRAARIRGAGSGGQILVSQSVKDLVEDDLGEIRLRDCGLHGLRDLLRPERLYAAEHPDLDSVTTPLRTLEAQPNNLPIQLTSFIGRQEEIASIRQMVMLHPLVTLLGAGGSGKTRLALQVAAELSGQFEDGIWLLSAAPLREEDALREEAARLLQLDLSVPSGRSRRNTLLILDNCEHLREVAARLVKQLLEHVDDLKVLATSREPLGVRGERHFPVHTMGLPPSDATADMLDQYESSALFLERAREKDPRVAMSASDAHAVAQIVRVLDGIPLAIEQAASHIGYLGPRLIFERLDEWMAEPSAYSEHEDPRHRTLEATIDWSYHLLSVEEQTLFVRLAIFPGSWDLVSAEAICSGEGLSATQTMRIMERLTNKSMVMFEAKQQVGQRYRFLEPVRQYAARLMPVCNDELREKHFQHFFERSVRLDERIGGSDQAAALAEAEPDIANHRLALEWVLQNRPDEALSMAMNLRRFWLLKGHIAEGRRHLAAAMHVGSHDAPLLASACNAAGGLAWLHGDIAEAERLYGRALELLLGQDDEALACTIRHNLGLMLMGKGRFDEAETLLTAAVQSFRGLGKELDAAQAMTSLANLFLEMGRPPGEAERVALDAIAIFEQHKFSTQLIYAMALAAEAMRPYKRSSSLAVLGKALDLIRLHDSGPQATVILYQLAVLAYAQGMLADAGFCLGAAENLLAESVLTDRFAADIAEMEKGFSSCPDSGADRSRSRGRRAKLSVILDSAIEVRERLDKALQLNYTAPDGT